MILCPGREDIGERRAPKTWKSEFLICVLLILFASPILNVIGSPPTVQSPTTVYVDPPQTVTMVDSTFSINISIAGVIDLCGWEFKLYYLNSVLNATGYEEGPFLKSGGSTGFYVPRFTDNYNETHGLVGMICTLNDFSGGGVDGSGVLASITFKAIGAGNSSLSLRETKLRDRNIQPITHTTTDGNVEAIGVHDIAVTNVNLFKTVVGQSYTMRLNVTLENKGEQTEIFNVTTYANDTTIQNKTITLTSKNSTTVVFTWNTTGIAYGNYTISAYVQPVLGEGNTTNNMYVGGTVRVVVPGDVTSGTAPGVPEGRVDMRDIGYIASKFGTTPFSPDWDPNADVNDDDRVDMRDIGIACYNYLVTEE
jgi:hypothetical protein